MTRKFCMYFGSFWLSEAYLKLNSDGRFVTPFADQQPFGLVKIIIRGSFKIILGGSFHWNTHSLTFICIFIPNTAHKLN